MAADAMHFNPAPTHPPTRLTPKQESAHLFKLKAYKGKDAEALAKDKGYYTALQKPGVRLLLLHPPTHPIQPTHPLTQPNPPTHPPTNPNNIGPEPCVAAGLCPVRPRC